MPPWQFLKDSTPSHPGKVQSQVNAAVNILAHGPSLGLSFLRCKVESVIDPLLFPRESSGLD